MGKLTHPQGRIIIKMDMQGKNSHTFEDGTKIALVRQVENFDRKYTEPILGVVVSAEKIPPGAEVLVHPNSTHDTNRIWNYNQLSGSEIANEINFYSIPESQCYLWRTINPQWQPYEHIYATGLRVFKPYKGILHGIEPTHLKDYLYVTSGSYQGQVVKTLRACDYELIFNDTNGREKRLIRFRPDGDYTSLNPAHHREPEIIAIMHEMTSMVNDGDLYVGLTKSDCRSINQLQNA